MHYPTDVAAGCLLGLLWLAVCTRVLRRSGHAARLRATLSAGGSSPTPGLLLAFERDDWAEVDAERPS